MAIEMLANEALPAHATSNTDAVKKARDCRVKVLANANPVVQDTSGVENSPMPPSEFDLNATHLISSPYRNLANQLRLESLGVQSRLFAFALTNLKPVQDNYAVAPYLTVFNWPFIFETLRALCNREGLKWKRQEFYVVIFRSKLRADTDQVRLGELDQKSHEEACTSGSLLHYWFGKADAERRNLATCEWIQIQCSDACC